MTKVTFSLQEDKILAVDILGHAGYAEEGEDIVCAAISSAVMLTHALLYDVQHIPVDTLIERMTERISALRCRKAMWNADRMHFVL